MDRRLESAQGPGLPRWDPRSDVGVYLGHSPEHAGSVALVLNLATGHVSPKYHLIFDDDFSTVPYLRTKEEPPNWEHLCKTSMENYMEQSKEGELDFAAEFRQNVGLDDMFTSMPVPDNENTPGILNVDQSDTCTPAADNSDGTTSHPSSTPTPESLRTLEVSTQTDRTVDTYDHPSNRDSLIDSDIGNSRGEVSHNSNNGSEDVGHHRLRGSFLKMLVLILILTLNQYLLNGQI